VAADPDEAAQIAEEHLKDHTVEDLYDTIVLPALQAAKHDVVEGRLDLEAMHVVRDGARDLVEEIEERDAAPVEAPVPSGKTGNEAAAPPPRAPRMALDGTSALLLPTGEETAPVAAEMLAGFLRREGMDARVLSGAALAGEMLETVRDRRPDVVCVVGLLPYGIVRARHLCKRLRSAGAETRIAVALWDAKADAERVEERISPACADRVAVTFAKAVEAVRSLAAEALATRPAGDRRPEPQPEASSS
jgi:hypothetical protein